MPRRASVKPVEDPTAEANPLPHLPEDDFVQSLKSELARAQRATGEKTGEDLSHRAALNRRLLQDLWEVHNQFEDISVHVTVEPSQTLFATFVEFPTKWSFKENFDFGQVKTIELKDRSENWVGFALRFWYYRTDEGKPHLRGIFEWCDGESYHKYTGWMRMMSQAVLFDAVEDHVDLKALHQVLKDIVVKWFAAHLERSPTILIDHLKAKYPKGATYAKESYRD
jgi:hypothetical protein